jgi:hypothetical protein
MKPLSRPLLLSCAIASTACLSGEPSEREVLEQMAAKHEVELRAFHSARGELADKYPMPQSLDFGQGGTVVLNDCSLGGRLGQEILRVRYTFVNSTNHPIREALLTLVVRDPATGAEEGEEMRLKFPYALTLTPDSTYTTWFEVPTKGLHLRPGWEWEVELEAVRGPQGPWAARRSAGS